MFNFYKLQANYKSNHFINPVALNMVNGNISFLLKSTSISCENYFNFSQIPAYNFILKRICTRKYKRRYKKDLFRYKRFAYKI